MNDNNFRFFLILFLMVLPIISVYLYTGYNIQSKEWEHQRMSKELNTKSDFSKYLEKENIKIYTVKDYDREYIKFISYINKQSNTEEIK